MKVLLVCATEAKDYDYIRGQVAKQTVQPDDFFYYIDDEPAITIDERRKRIANNQNLLALYVEKSDCDFVWQIEGDCELPDIALEKLIYDMEIQMNENFGYISGMQVGRHGLYCIGAWHVADDRKSFESIEAKGTHFEQVDATGFYCLLAKKDVWLSGQATWDGEAWGPDVNWGLSIKEEKYITRGLHIGHKASGTVIYPTDNCVCDVKFTLNNDKWEYKIL